MSYFTVTKIAGFRVAGTAADGRKVYYTGSAGAAFVSSDARRAFGGYKESGAQAVADRLNRGTALHGIKFSPEAE